MRNRRGGEPLGWANEWLAKFDLQIQLRGQRPKGGGSAGRPRQQHLAASARAGARRSRQRVCYVHESMCGEWSRQTRGGELPCTLQPTPSFSFFVIVVHENPQDYTASSPTPCLIQITRPHIPPSPPPPFHFTLTMLALMSMRTRCRHPAAITMSSTICCMRPPSSTPYKSTSFRRGEFLRSA